MGRTPALQPDGRPPARAGRVQRDPARDGDRVAKWKTMCCSWRAARRPWGAITTAPDRFRGTWRVRTLLPQDQQSDPHTGPDSTALSAGHARPRRRFGRKVPRRAGCISSRRRVSMHAASWLSPMRGRPLADARYGSLWPKENRARSDAETARCRGSSRPTSAQYAAVVRRRAIAHRQEQARQWARRKSWLLCADRELATTQRSLARNSHKVICSAPIVRVANKVAA